MTPTAPRFHSAAVSDQGPVRSNNEDRVWADDARGIFLVVDGMGGHEAGEHAAEIAVERIRARLERQTGTADQRVREAITLANNAVYEAARSIPEWNGMACVLTVAVVEDGRATVGHVGDSRLYKLRRGAIRKITHDHSPVGEREDSGELTEQEAMRHPRRNEVFRDVGTQPRTPGDDEFIETASIDFEPDSALLLCSDGLSDAIPSTEILRIVEENARDPHSAARELIAAATPSAKDNISVVLVFGQTFVRSGRTRAATGEDTGRLAPVGGASGGISRFLWALGGLLLGALAVFSALAWRDAHRELEPRAPIMVSAPASIASALEKAKPGDIVIVGPGTYTGPVQLKDDVQVIARPAYEATIVGPVLANGLRSGRLEGFLIRDADVGVRIQDSDVLISRCEITLNRTAGIEISGNSRATVSACRIKGNAGPGIIVADSATPAIEHNLISGNAARPGAGGPGLFIRSQYRPRVFANTFSGNGAEAVWLPGEDDTIVRDNFFVGPSKMRVRIVRQAGVDR